MFWATLSAWLHIMSWELKEDFLQDYEKFEKSEIFKEVLLLWQKIDFISRHKNLWVNSLYPLLKSDFPYVFYSEKFDNEIDINEIRKIRYNFFPLDKMFEGNNYLKEIPIDMAIVFTGQKQSTDIIEHAIMNNKTKCDELWSFIEKDLLKWCGFKDNTSFYTFAEKNHIYEQISNTATIMWIKSVYLLKKIYEQWFDINTLHDFIDQINVLRNMLSLVEKQEDFADDFIYSIEMKI